MCRWKVLTSRITTGIKIHRGSEPAEPGSGIADFGCSGLTELLPVLARFILYPVTSSL